MLFALRQPPTLLGLLLGLAVGCYLRAALQQAVIGGPRSLRRLRDPKVWIDPYGIVGALIGGIGWSPRPELSRFKPRQVWTVTVVAVLAHAVLAAIGLELYVIAGGSRELLTFTDTISVLHGTQPFAITFAEKVALGFGIENLACGLLVLIPIPPLELGVALWSTLPRAPGARRLAYRLLEESWGVLAILVLLVLPLAGEQPALLQLIGSLSNDILGAL
jgi:hypothetical protein